MPDYGVNNELNELKAIVTYYNKTGFLRKIFNTKSVVIEDNYDGIFSSFLSASTCTVIQSSSLQFMTSWYIPISTSAFTIFRINTTRQIQL